MEKTTNIKRLLSLYSLKKSVEVSKSNLADPYLYVHSNDKALLCPFMTNMPNIMYCGNHCAKLNILAHIGEDKKPTGKVVGIQECGARRVVLFDNISINFEDQKKKEDGEGKEVQMKKD